MNIYFIKFHAVALMNASLESIGGEMKRLISQFGICIVLMVIGSVSHASDLDDGISKYKDDSIAKLDGLGDKLVNRRFIILKAKAKANQAKKRDDCKSLKGYDGVSNSIVIEAGGAENVREVINVHDGRGNSTVLGCTK